MAMDAHTPDSQAPLVVDVEAEIAHWRARYRDLPQCRHMRWEDVKPALQLGVDAYLKASGRDVVEMMDELELRYQRTGKDSRLDWSQARDVVAAVWVRICDQNRASHASSGDTPQLTRPVIGMRLR